MSKPEIRERAREPICPNCGGDVKRRSPKGPVPTFCGKPCKVAMQNRLTVEGRAIVAFAKAWRIDRGTGPIATASFQQFVETLDRFNSIDNETNRPRADLYAAKVMADGTRYIDRRRGPLAPRIAAKLKEQSA